MSLFGSTSTFGGFGAASATTQSTNKDIEVAQPPSDTISCIRFSPTANFLVASSWDNNVGFFNYIPFIVYIILKTTIKSSQ